MFLFIYGICWNLRCAQPSRAVDFFDRLFFFVPLCFHFLNEYSRMKRKFSFAVAEITITSDQSEQ